MTKNGALASRATAPENICLSVLLDTLLTPSHVMFSVFASSEVERGFESQSDQTRLYIYIIGCVASPLSAQYQGETAKTD